MVGTEVFTEGCQQAPAHISIDSVSPKSVNVFVSGITLIHYSFVSQTVTGPCQLQLCAVKGSSAIKKTVYCNILSLVFLLYLCILCTSLQQQWLISDNPTDHSYS